jgi:ABC-type sugar transport system ATPase subunit
MAAAAAPSRDLREEFRLDTPLLELWSIENVFPPRPERRLGPTALEVMGLSDGEKFREVDFHIRRGEIVGFSGLMGAGRTQVARVVFGLDPAAAGAIRIKGRARADPDRRGWHEARHGDAVRGPLALSPLCAAA